MKLPVIAAVCGLFAAPACAVTVTVQSFTSDADLAAAYNARSSALNAVEDFEAFGIGELAADASLSTSVGDFTTLGGLGSGDTVTDSPFPNTGTNIAVREGEVLGRTDTTEEITGVMADQFLDSNDTLGIEYTANVSDLPFNRILLTLTDASDTGANLTILGIGDDPDELFTIGRGRPNANRRLVEITFDAPVTTATLLFSNDIENDGFSLDDIGVNTVPLPASALLLLGGLGGMTLLRRKQA